MDESQFRVKKCKSEQLHHLLKRLEAYTKHLNSVFGFKKKMWEPNFFCCNKKVVHYLERFKLISHGRKLWNKQTKYRRPVLTKS